MIENNVSNNTPATDVMQEDQGLNIKEYIYWAWEKKWWIALSVALCLCVAAFYIYTTPKQYVRSASVMMKSDSRGQANIGELEAFKELGGLSNMSVDVLNEIEAFKSPILMERVVKRLHLDTEYYAEGTFKDVLLYGNSPVRIDFAEGTSPAGFTFRVRKTGDNEVELYGFRYKGDKVGDGPVRAALSDTVQTPAGRLTVSPTLLFAEGFGGTMRVACYDASLMAQAYLRKMTFALAQKQTSVIKLGIKDVSIRRGDDVINTLIDVYNEEWVSYMNESTVNTSRFIDERLVVIEQELGQADSNVEKFKRENELFDISSEVAQTVQESSEYSAQYFQVTNQLAVARYIRDYLNNGDNSKSLLPANSGVNNSNLESQIAEYNKTMLRRNTLVDNSSESNPLVDDYNQALEQMRASILRSVENLISTLDLQARNIEKRESNIRSRMAATPGQAKELVNRERQQKIKEQLYLYLLQKREENELSASIVVNNTRILSYANGSPVPVAPKTMVIFSAMFILGLAIPFTYKILKDMLNTTVRGKKDLENLSAPFVGEVPFVGKRRQILCFTRETSGVDPHKIVVVEQGNRNIINEAFRVVRANLDFMRRADKSHPAVIMFTSYNVNSGKTFVAANLAAIMAVRGERTVVLDLDMRKASLSRMVGKPKTGVSSYLSGAVDSVQDITVSYPGQDGLDVIPVGTLPPNPAELLQSERFDRLMQELRSRYTYIFIDCPPVDVVADTSIVAHVADVTLFVVRAGLMERALIGEVEKIYRSGRLNNMAVLLNGTRQLSSRYGYRYGYHYGYGYGHDYYSE